MWKKLLDAWKSDNLLDLAWQRSYEMLAITEEMFLEAVRILRESDDKEVKQEIRQLDKTVNSYERDVRRKVLIHLTSRAPSPDLASGLVLLVIIIDIERIGDFAKNMVDLAIEHPDRLEGRGFEEELEKIEAAVKDSFVRTRNCVESSDRSAALDYLRDYRWVSRTCDECLNALVKSKDKDLPPGEAAALTLYFRWLKRINSHLRNIATSIVNPYDRIGFKPKQ